RVIVALGAVEAERRCGFVAGMPKEDVEVLDYGLPLAVGREARRGNLASCRILRRARLFGDERFEAIGDVVVEHRRGVEGGVVGRVVHRRHRRATPATAAAARGESRALGAGVGGEVTGPEVAAEAEGDGALTIDEAQAAGAGAAASVRSGRIEEGQRDRGV